MKFRPVHFDPQNYNFFGLVAMGQNGLSLSYLNLRESLHHQPKQNGKKVPILGGIYKISTHSAKYKDVFHLLDHRHALQILSSPHRLFVASSHHLPISCEIMTLKFTITRLIVNVTLTKY